VTGQELSFAHLGRLTTPLGLFEHALGPAPRPEHGYCVDDVARALVVAAREHDPASPVHAWVEVYLDFVLGSVRPDGYVCNRRRVDGTWNGRPSSDDHWGRALWALGTAAAESSDPGRSARARSGALIAMRARSTWPRSMAYGALGAVQLLRVDAEHSASIRFLADVRRVLPRPGSDPAWPWPEDRLTYANAVLPEAMLVVGEALGDEGLREDGLLILGWLVARQQRDGHLSVVPSTGWSRADGAHDSVVGPVPGRAGFAQQPIEVAALAEACRTAYVATGDRRWADVIGQCHAWFAGANDGGVVMCDPTTGGGFDGLERHGASANQGAESTLAWLSTQQISLMPEVVGAR
jgi:hypothetical protein